MFTASSLLSIKRPFNLMFLLHAASLFLPANILPYSGATIRIKDKREEDALLLWDRSGFSHKGSRASGSYLIIPAARVTEAALVARRLPLWWWGLGWHLA
jgi:hypothetical protein